ncbi:hypothetical protein [Stenotrophomonas maltophilia]|uniref:hypothetical protein n=1 Tax=Stenotrophomonas maltophilia TaxID=40324 RepID=UPI001F536CAD|nr:hypothetical protein [Stenotrophomonas maltophilia]MCI1149025.1 hypothetical protein [Stenotrophomonas maltophilia]
MTTDNKTLADAQPGGRVRLGDQAERARFEAWAHAQSYRGGNIMADRDSVHPDVYADPIAQLTWKSWQAALSAQPSPGGQGATFPWENFPAYLIDKCEGDTISEEGLQQALATMAKDERYCLAARQPVAVPLASPGKGEWSDGWNACREATLRGEVHPVDDTRQPVGQSQTHWGWLVDGVPFKGSSTCEMSAVPLYAGEPDPPLVVRVPRHEAAPYFECKPEQWEQHTHGMTTAGKNVLANMLAHHCLLARRDELGWIITRYDLIAECRPWWHVSNNGKLTYDYDPATKARMVAAPTVQTVDLGAVRDVFRRWHANELNSTDAMLALVEALAVIDSQAVGNG